MFLLPYKTSSVSFSLVFPQLCDSISTAALHDLSSLLKKYLIKS